MCIVQGCRRTPPRGQRICGSCWAVIPAATKLAIFEHGDAYKDPAPWAAPFPSGTPEDPGAGTRAIRHFRQFLIWSHQEAVSRAAVECFEIRTARMLEDLRARAGAEDDT
jgi:hypothetical protein